jgi:sensor histidine kinase YesM
LNIDLEKIMVPAFIIQPFVENAIKHGFSGQKPDGLIKISLFKSNEILHIAIEDNGIGRTAASEQKKWFKPHQSMGQQLIADRLNLLNDIYDWGLSYTVEDLHYPTGTKVLLRIPFMH